MTEIGDVKELGTKGTTYGFTSWQYSCNETYKQARNQFGTPGGAKSIPGGPKFVELCPISLKCVQHISLGGRKIF